MQEAANLILNTWPVVCLVNSPVAINIGHILQPEAKVHKVGCQAVLDYTVKDARTNRSLKFLGQRKAISGEYRIALHSHYKVLRVGRWRLHGDHLEGWQNWMVHVCDPQRYSSRLLLVKMYLHANDYLSK